MGIKRIVNQMGSQDLAVVENKIKEKKEGTSPNSILEN
jgi:hypothetical protein